jgi:RNA polymerase sigma-70 factor, ECF subfamily
MPVALGRKLTIADNRDKKKVQTAHAWASQDEDVRLMLEFKAGRAEAFEELVHRNTPKVHALVLRFLGDQGQVEDLTQEVFLRVYRTADRYQPSAKFTTWLYRIAANLSFNVLRSRKKMQVRQLRTVETDDSESFSEDVTDERHLPPHQRMDHEELRQKIAAAIQELPENQRVAIVLNKYEEKSYEEIAEFLDCSTMAVKSLLSRARTNLKGTLHRYMKKG